MKTLTASLTTSLAGLSAAAAIVLGGLHFAPTPSAPLGTPPTTDVAIELRQVEPGVIADGEVTTTVYRVIDPLAATARVGGSVATSTKSTWTAALPDGEYLIKTVPTPASTLSSADDTDGPSPVPAGSGCTNRLDCIWISVAGNTWSFHGKLSPNPDAAEFSLSRRNATSSMSAAAGPATTTTTTTAVAVGPTASTTMPTTQTMEVVVLDWTDDRSWSKPVAGAAVIVQFTDPKTQIPFTVADRTDSNGHTTHTIPLRQYTVIVHPPAGYELLDTTHLGTFSATTKPLETATHVVGLRRIPESAATANPPAVAPQTPAPVNQVAGGQPVDTTPTTTAPAAPTPEAPAPVTAAPDTTTSSTTTTTAPPVAAPTRTLGCDESDDPEIQALLRLNDGAIRWIEDGELLTLYPEPGMDPVVVCDAAYHRIVDMGIDADYVSGGG
jgi:hypothetical protein